MPWPCRPGEPAGKFCSCGAAATVRIYAIPEPTRTCPFEAGKHRGQWGTERGQASRLRTHFPPEWQRSKAKSSPPPPHASSEDWGAQGGRAAGTCGPLPGGSVLPHLLGLKGPRGGAGGRVGRRSRPSIAPGGVSVLLLLLSRLPSLYPAPLPPPPPPRKQLSAAPAAGLSRGGGGGGGCLASSRSLGNATSSPPARWRGGRGGGRGLAVQSPDARAPRGCRGNGMPSGRPRGDGGGRRRHAEGGGRLALPCCPGPDTETIISAPNGAGLYEERG